MYQNTQAKTVLVILISAFCKFKCYEYDGRRHTTQSVNKVFEKYMLAVKKISADFPNHEIELHLDIAGADVDRPRRRFNYIHMRQPTEYEKRGVVRSGGGNYTEITKLPTPSVFPTDPEMRPVYMKDLKKAMEELDKKYSKQIGSVDVPYKTEMDVNMKNILQLLEKGTLVSRDVVKPPEENMSWLQIKIPNK